MKKPSDKRAFYVKKGQTYGPERYGGMVRFGMWLLRPRVVREFRGWTELRSLQGPYFLAIVDAVDEVHTDATLRRFWRNGLLAPNRKHSHPYQVDVPEEYRTRTAGSCWTRTSIRLAPGSWIRNCRSSPWRWCWARPPNANGWSMLMRHWA